MKRKLSSLSDIPIPRFLAGCSALIHAFLKTQYRLHRDGLDIILNARQLAWGYVAYPPITPYIARNGLTLYGNSLPGLRLSPALSQGGVILFGGMITRDME
jgi:hypothetical protein